MKVLFAWTSWVPWTHRFGILQETRHTEESGGAVPRIPTTYNPIWEDINLNAVLDRMHDGWRTAWELGTLLHKLSPSQGRKTSIMDLCSAWNKRMIGLED